MNPLIKRLFNALKPIVGYKQYSEYHTPQLAHIQTQLGYSTYNMTFNLIYRAYSQNIPWDKRPSHEQIFQIAYDIVKNESLKPHFHYRHFTKPKKNGGVRELAEPDPILKDIQYEIIRRHLGVENRHPTSVGFVKGKSIADHVWAHAGAQWIITCDIADFFPNTKRWRVLDFWKDRFPEQEEFARFLTTLTTYKGGLPQGAPTSPTLSNEVNYRMDKVLHDRIESSGGVYTRYADDIVFSWQGNHPPPADFKQAVMGTLNDNGYELNPRKGWHEYQAKDEPEITGVILTKKGKVKVPSWIHDRINELEKDPDESAKLSGYKGFVNMIENRKSYRLTT
jgi:RNA-directed DNA polymerase